MLRPSFVMTLTVAGEQRAGAVSPPQELSAHPLAAAHRPRSWPGRAPRPEAQRPPAWQGLRSLWTAGSGGFSERACAALARLHDGWRWRVPAAEIAR